jgi:hypothetical protein
MQKHAVCRSLAWILAPLTAVHAQAPNAPSSFDPVVRMQGSTNMATGTLIGESLSGSDLTMTFLTAEHVVRKYTLLTDIGFGDLSSPKLDLTNFINVATVTGGATKMEDLAIVGVTINLGTLTSAQQNYLLGVSPLSVGLAPPSSSLPYDIEAFGYGSSGNPATVYGSQATYFAQVDTQAAYSGTYEGKAYTEPVQYWTYHNPNILPGEGTGFGGYSGSPLFLYSSMAINTSSPVIGIQVQGAQPVNGAVSMGIDFTSSEVNWIDSESQSLLAPVPIPASAWLLLSALGGVGVMSMRGRRTALSPL